MKCELTQGFRFASSVPKKYTLLVGIIDDPELAMVANLLIHGGDSLLPEKFYDTLPDILGDWDTGFEVIHIPARDFLTETQKEFGYGWQATFDDYLKQTFNIYKSICMLGDRIVEQMKMVIQYHNWAPNGYISTTFKERTGGSNRPLVDTGHMLDSITYKVIEE